MFCFGSSRLKWQPGLRAGDKALEPVLPGERAAPGVATRGGLWREIGGLAGHTVRFWDVGVGVGVGAIFGGWGMWVGDVGGGCGWVGVGVV